MDLDDVDRRIIVLLQQDGRMSSREISRRLDGIGDRAVRYRIERLVKCGAISITAVVNNEVIGYPILGDVVMGVVPSKVREALAVLVADERVCCLGAEFERGSLTIQVAARDEPELHAWVRDLVQRLGGVTSVETLVVDHLAKDSDHWPPPRD